MSYLACPTFSEVQSVLMAHARHPHAPATLALAGVVAHALSSHGMQWLPMPGLDAAVTRRVLHTWFPGGDALLGLDWPALTLADRPEPRFDEIEELMALLLSHAAPGAGAADVIRNEPDAATWPEQAQAVACALACASLGHNHLWQDLYLPSRTELSALLFQWFPTLAERNTQHMKWKKFFYKQLCERADINICKSPTCNVCTDYAVCFGPETAVGVAVEAVVAGG